MKPYLALVLAVAAAFAGFAAGRAVDAPAPTATVAHDGPVQPNDRGRPTRAEENPLEERDRRRAQTESSEPDRPSSRAKGTETRTTSAGTPAQGPASDDESDDDNGDPEDARKHRELVSAGELCVELLGKPFEGPKDLPERFSGASVSGAVRNAIKQSGAPGDVEGVDCSEFPCIVFGRLTGAEKDLEKIERSPALEPYEGDVLTLLLWATTIEEGTAAHPTEREGGLFALAYYSFDDRAGAGDELDRRIRARVLEVWNEDRPGPTEPAPNH